MARKLHILSLGCGNMGAAILSGILARFPEAEVLAVDPSVERARSLLPATDRAVVVSTLDEVRDFAPDLTMVAVKPQQFSDLVAEAALADRVASGVVVSIMAGTPLATLRAALGAVPVVRVMPNLPAQVGAAMTVGFAGAEVKDAQRDLVQTAFEATGAFRWLESEDEIDAATAVAGSGPGYVFAIAEYFEAAARAEGLDAETARLLVRQTLLGAALMLSSDDREAQALKEAVTSKGGTTAAGLAVLEAAEALPKLLPAAIRAAHARARALAEG